MLTLIDILIKLVTYVEMKLDYIISNCVLKKYVLEYYSYNIKVQLVIYKIIWTYDMSDYFVIIKLLFLH